ncbi:TRAP transporter small permease [Jiella avicenniae]|uniref:TRAP transporter small permease protein n=1 Tax=Jiella avicenniae TaxID=2907202 RepID=A0A9X1NX16_9HYPH|nr:TRAP transporter small permease [Jiella avicenniae]MCE7027142.1 TRAP transporter small permease [Jiella avicenniae]
MGRFLKVLDRTEDAAMVAGLALATVLVVIQVVLRYVFNSSIFWAEELVRYTIVWTAFIGAGMGLRNGKHISVDLLQTFLPERPARLVALAGVVIGCLFSVLLFWYGLALVRHALAMGQLSSAMRIPMGWVYLILPIAGVLQFVRFSQIGWELHTGRRTARIDIDHLAREAGV